MPGVEIGAPRNLAPQRGAAVNWQHPLATRLRLCVGRGQRILSNQAIGSTIAGVGNYGVALKNNGSGTEVAFPYSPPSGGWTHAAVVTVTSVAPATVASVYRVGTVTTTDRTIGIYTGNVWATYIYDGATKYATGAAAAIGPAVVVGTSTGTAIRTWVNGVPGTAVATSLSGFDYGANATYWSVGRTGNGANGFGNADATFPGVVHLAATWDRVLNDTEILAFTVDPFGFLRF